MLSSLSSAFVTTKSAAALEGMQALDASPPSITPPESPADTGTGLWSCQWPTAEQAQAKLDGWEAIDTQRSAGDSPGCQFAFDEEDAWVNIDEGEPIPGRRSQSKTDLSGFVSVGTVKVGSASTVVTTDPGASLVTIPRAPAAPAIEAPPEPEPELAPPKQQHNSAHERDADRRILEEDLAESVDTSANITAEATSADAEAAVAEEEEGQPSEEQQSYMAAAAEQLMQVSAMITEQFQAQLEQQRIHDEKLRKEADEKAQRALREQRNHQKKLRKEAQNEAQAEKEALRLEMLAEKEDLEKRLREEMRNIGEQAKADALQLQQLKAAELDKETTQSPKKSSKEWRRSQISGSHWRQLSKEVDADEKSMAQEIMQRVDGTEDCAVAQCGPATSTSKGAATVVSSATPWVPQPKQKPNACCACGSGKKFKKCCRVAERM